MRMADARLPRSTGVSILGLLPHNCLPHFTSCLTKTRLVTEFVTREDPGLTRSAQVEVGGPQLIYPGRAWQSLNLSCPASLGGLLSCDGPGSGPSRLLSTWFEATRN